MKLSKLYLTKNECYKAGRKLNVKGLMLHSTGVNNPNLRRYVGPDDGVLGVNNNGNHWNQPRPDGRQVCVHGFIGKDKNGVIRTYQTLPWDMQAWHCGGSGNQTHIGIEICEDARTDAKYFNLVYNEAVEVFAYLCKMFGLTERDIIDHSEGRKLGIASNHGDVMHWFPKFGKSMDTFRRDVQIRLLGKPTASKPTVNPTQSSGSRIDKLAREVIKGMHGNGAARQRSLGSDYAAVQRRVNELSGVKPKATSGVSESARIDKLAREAIAGKYGNGASRQRALGRDYTAVQKRVNQLLR